MEFINSSSMCCSKPCWTSHTIIKAIERVISILWSKSCDVEYAIFARQTTGGREGSPQWLSEVHLCFFLMLNTNVSLRHGATCPHPLLFEQIKMQNQMKHLFSCRRDLFDTQTIYYPYTDPAIKIRTKYWLQRANIDFTIECHLVLVVEE